MEQKRIEELRTDHEHYCNLESMIHGGSGTAAQMGHSYKAGHDAFAEWIIDGFPALLDEVEMLLAERDALLESVRGVCRHCKAPDAYEVFPGEYQCPNMDTRHIHAFTYGPRSWTCDKWEWRGLSGKDVKKEEMVDTETIWSRPAQFDPEDRNA